MSQENLTKQWVCKCSTVNALRKRHCVNCGRKVPKKVLNKIYAEEIKTQNIFFRMLRRAKEISGFKKAGEILTKLQTAMIVFWIVALLVCNVPRLYYCSEQISIYRQTRETRLQYESDLFTEHLTGAKELPGVISNVLESTINSIDDATRGLTEEREDIKKDFNDEKINHIVEKINYIIEMKNHIVEKFMEVIDYVTGKLK